MNAMFEQIEIGASQSLKIKKYHISNIDIPYHYHPEIEIVLILSSTGKVFVRNSMVVFKPGNLFIFGSNVPHLLINDKIYHNDELEVRLLVIQFHPDLFGNHLFNLPELINVQKLINNSNAGIKLESNKNWSKKNAIVDLLNTNNIERFTKILLMLDRIQRKHKFQFIDKFIECSDSIDIPIRIQNVNRFLLQNYHREISLDEIANIANMNKSSFCRYFKVHTNKTFSEFLNELRVDYASKLLIEGSLSISSIGYEVGYNNLPYFIKRFYKIKGINPKEYRAKYKWN
ncbi:AraC family transcriptional regulator [Changchengzhania lutea]|uniref:AraC family transcriptional regulator n=1 Tax=Changchengzhania lutea TaxID=2049305 RepID=UPI00115EB285|nr:AraC family transcriptional regulator [Changchengzhania lutea]